MFLSWTPLCAHSELRVRLCDCYIFCALSQPLGNEAQLSLRCCWCCSMSRSERTIWDRNNNIDIRAFQDVIFAVLLGARDGLLALLEHSPARWWFAHRPTADPSQSCEESAGALLSSISTADWAGKVCAGGCRVGDGYLVGVSSPSYQPGAVPG